MDRRTFLKDAALLVAGLGLSPGFLPRVADALETLSSGRAPVLWLHGQACSGCSVSFLNAESPGPADLVTRYLSLYFHPTLSAATGGEAMGAIEKAMAAGNYILVLEGSIPLKVPESCILGEEPFGPLFLKAAQRAKAVLAVGACAAFGGVAAAPPNPTGAASAGEAMKKGGVKTPLVNIPGCPVHPDWLVGTVVHLLKLGMPELDQLRRPKRNFGRLLHELCPYFAAYQEKRFALNFGEPGCQFKLGCQGVITHADCSLRGWNGGINWCLPARGVCVGCAHPDFVRNPNFALYRFSEGESRSK